MLGMINFNTFRTHMRVYIPPSLQSLQKLIFTEIFYWEYLQVNFNPSFPSSHGMHCIKVIFFLSSLDLQYTLLLMVRGGRQHRNRGNNSESWKSILVLSFLYLQSWSLILQFSFQFCWEVTDIYHSVSLRPTEWWFDLYILWND